MVSRYPFRRSSSIRPPVSEIEPTSVGVSIPTRGVALSDSGAAAGASAPEPPSVGAVATSPAAPTSSEAAASGSAARSVAGGGNITNHAMISAKLSAVASMRFLF